MKAARISLLFASLFFTLVWQGCNNGNAGAAQPSDSTKTAAAADTVKPVEQPAERYWNDLARYLAGREPLAGSVLSRIETRPEAAEHRAFFQAKWEKKNAELYSKLVDFGQAEFPVEQKTTGNVLYPFSGPDFMTLHTLFPTANKYVMFGLEPEGNEPDINKIPDEQLAANLKNIQHSLDAMVKQSFFMTNEMRVDFRRKELNGTTPIILLFMSLRDLTVLDVKRIQVDDNGGVKYLPKNDSTKQTTEDTLITGVEIKFRSANGPAQTLQYWSFDAEDKAPNSGVYWSFTKRYNMHKYLESLKPAVVYLKSASYLLHGGHFATIRKVLLETGDFFLQDDTGVPLRLFKTDPAHKWDVKFYGKYEGTLPQFSYAYQKDLAQVYATDSSVKRDLGFRMGYNHRFNLQIARKTKN